MLAGIWLGLHWFYFDHYSKFKAHHSHAHAWKPHLATNHGRILDDLCRHHHHGAVRGAGCSHGIQVGTTLARHGWQRALTYISCVQVPVAVVCADMTLLHMRVQVIDAHGAGLLEHGGAYYWYGSKRTINATGTQMDGGIALYSSTNLYEWKYESVVLKPFNCTSNNTRSLPRARSLSSSKTAAPAASYPPPSCANGNGAVISYCRACPSSLCVAKY